MSIVRSELETINSEVTSLESHINIDIKKKISLRETNSSTTTIESILAGYSEQLKKYQMKMHSLQREIPNTSENGNLIKSHSELLKKIDHLIICIKKTKPSNCDDSSSKNTLLTGMSLENKDVSEEFSNLIKKMKTISREIDNTITNEQVLIENQYNKLDNIGEEISETKLKLMNLMENGSNTCLVCIIAIEIVTLVLLFL